MGKVGGEGADLLTLTSTLYWWLEGYGAFIRRLDEHYRSTCSDELCIIYRLDEPKAATSCSA
jgi:hypothetical protein